MRINTNIASLNAQRNLSQNTKALSRALERLASGQRINRASDDASGLARSEGLLSQSRGLAQAARNANDSINFFRIAESTLATQSEIVQRMRELALQAANGTIGSKERSFLNQELGQLYEEFHRLSNTAEFAGTKILNGSLDQLKVQVGANKENQINFSLSGYGAQNLFSYSESAGSGQYSAPISSALGTNLTTPTALASADVNGDGNEDIIQLGRVISGVVKDQLQVYLGDGSGGYTMSASYDLTVGNLHQLKLEDLDSDGKLDITVTSNDSLFTYMGDGHGNFSLESTQSEVNFVQFGDVNGDGFADKVVAWDDAFSTAQVQLFLGTGNGNFSESGITLFSGAVGGASITRLELQDLEGDGDLDVLYGITDGGASNNIIKFVNDGHGEFSSGVTVTGLNQEGDIHFIDLNDDGRLDAVKGASANNYLYTYLQQADGSFTLSHTFDVATGKVFRIQLGDYDADGKVDIFALDSNGHVSTFHNEGSGNLNKVSNVATGGSGLALTLTDFNGDNALDYVTTSSTTDKLFATAGSLTTYQRLPGQDFVVDISTQENASNLLGILDLVMDNINDGRAQMGAAINRLESASQSISLTRDNLEAARSQIKDADMAAETAELVKNQILQQASIAVLGQANASIQIVLNLLNF